MNDVVTVVGIVATTPRHITNSDGEIFTSFRLASSQGKFVDGAYVSTASNWYTIHCEGNLAVNVNDSIVKGDKIIVVGNIIVRDWYDGQRTGTNIEIAADAVGHDLNYGVASFNRVIK